MGLDYLLVHLTYNIPLAVVMTIAYWPFFTKLDVYRISTLITIAVLSTIPWDSYLIENQIWTYPPDAVLGPTIWSIPIEEVFFFIIQTYNTSLLYIVLTKRLVKPMYLSPSDMWKRNIGIVFIVTCLGLGIAGIHYGGKFTYLGLIVGWVSPFMFIQWLAAWSFMLRLPCREILLAICIPTAYLWCVDTIALGNGTWVIENNTKLGIQLWGWLDIEEALFFLVTNVMIVMGQMATDNAIALAVYNMATTDEKVSECPSFGQSVIVFIEGHNNPLDLAYINALGDAVERLKQRSQSMYLGSAMFVGRLRIDLIFLYSFCRVIDDLVDEAPDRYTARTVVQECAVLLHKRFAGEDISKLALAHPMLLSSIERLPIDRLSIEPLQGLLKGFETDLDFDAENNTFPISTEKDLERYAFHVAGTIAESVIELTTPNAGYNDTHRQILTAGLRMGQALQYVNIARDISRDAEIHRVYLPTSWLEEKNLTPAHVVSCPDNPQLNELRSRLLDKADECYRSTEQAIGELPLNVQGPIRVTVESYMEIGKMLRKGDWPRMKGKMKVPLLRRLRVAYKALLSR
ncbi:uncharacterized protein ASPGLDRAFT_1515831 [Aspergillus glaucus CBS 516.65]|uniref:Bifunctional lycopene cyclase/phytoene synthase n=1 Tax=Aspergillus glaucus CBS 516.65 TaxID=1160497 RepID=A0A1L9VN38_ASPGL|nr:hypothetical protein ASPGLDRAFT_1515831 [Aspergillus glaucus CBS 516.65]OJJ85290.1 hypothetical protein ASPGLDRAFT_1515831 [Aspergillus glaucus CBS 516.65]